MTNTALVPLDSNQLREWDQKIIALRPELKQAPVTARWAALVLAHTHGLDPLQKEIIPIEVQGKWQPYITLDGARGNADRRGLDYQRVLSPLSDKWAMEFFGLSAEETRQMMELREDDMVWVCAIYVNGKPHPFVHLGVVGTTFPYKGKTARWRMAAIRAERPALLAACRLPYIAGVDSAEFDTNGQATPEQEPPIEGELTVVEDPEIGFLADVCEEIPYFSHPNHVINTLAKLELKYTEHPEATLFAALHDYATRRANEKAAAEAGIGPPDNPEDAYWEGEEGEQVPIPF